MFTKALDDVLKCLFCSQPRDILFTDIEEQTINFHTLNQRILDIFSQKITKSDEVIMKIVADY